MARKIVYKLSSRFINNIRIRRWVPELIRQKQKSKFLPEPQYERIGHSVEFYRTLCYFFDLAPADLSSFPYSFFASFKMGRSASASFHSAKKS